MSDDLILVSGPENGVAEIALNRPERMNAITPDLLRAMDEATKTLGADPALRAVVLRGEGRAFCAGLDKTGFENMMKSGAGSLGGEIMDRTHGPGNLFQHAARMWRELPVPVVASLHGVCLGGGFQIALGADMRIAAPDTRLSILEMKWGLVPDMGGNALMRRLARADVIRRLVYTHEMFEAEAAQGYGFVTEVAPDPLARARELAAEIASRSPSAMRAAKELLNVADEEAEAEVLLAESRLQKGLIGQPDQIETVMAAMQGRPANYG